MADEASDARVILAVGPASAIALLRVVHHALSAGWSVVLASDHHPAQSLDHPALTRVALPPVPRQRSAGVGLDPDRARAVAALREVARRVRPHLVHVHGLDAWGELCALARLHPMVVSVWGFLNDLLEAPSRTPPAPMGRALHDSAAVLVESEPLARAIEAVTSPPTRVEMLPLGVDAALFAPSSRARARWRRALAVPEDALMIVSPRGWAPFYNQAVVFDGFRRARARVSRPLILVFVRLTRDAVAGTSAAEMRRVEQAIDDAGLRDAVRWLPAMRHPMMAGLFAAADVLVSIPSSDAMPSTLIEAAACGLPFVVSDLPHYRGTFIERGTRVDPTDSEAVAVALVEHAEGAARVDPVALRDEVCARYTPADTRRRLVDIYARHGDAPARPRPAVSAIITTYDRPDLLPQAVDSALAQTEADLEIIVVDDGSAPATRAALAPYAGRITVVHKANGGLASARNAGLRVARGRYVAFLDDDDRWAPDRISALLPVIEADPAVDVVFGDMRYVDLDGRRLGTSTCFGDRPPPPGPVHPELLFVCNVVPGGAVLVRYTALAEVGFLDESLRTAEDYDLWLRLSARGPQAFRRVDRVVADYRQHQANISRTAVDRMTLDVLRVREKAYDRSPRLRAMHPALLDRRLFGLYLQCAERALARGDGAGASALVQRFVARRGETPWSRSLSARLSEGSNP